MMTNPRQSKGDRGYTLLFAVLIAVLVLGVAVFIVGFAEKQYILASTARESMYSIYAADGALECAASAFLNGSVSSTSMSTISCGSAQSPGGLVRHPNDQYPAAPFQPPVTTWYYDMVPLDNGECARIVFTSGLYNGSPGTAIDSYGYNQCTGSGSSLGPSTAPTTVERAFRLTYGGAW